MGTYLAIENEDGRFLKSHHLPSGNLFKMEAGSGELQHHAAGAVTNRSDLFEFMNTFRRGNLLIPGGKHTLRSNQLLFYRAICECIHHYDVSDGKNYDFYLNPQTVNGRFYRGT